MQTAGFTFDFKGYDKSVKIMTMDGNLTLARCRNIGNVFVFENITALQPSQHRMAWKQMMFPDFILSAERWSALSRTGFLGLETLYESREGYGGALAGTLKALYGEGLQEAFDAQGVALKSRLED